MASTFAGLVISGNGLSASKVGLAVTSNNISNMNTTGYSRQVLIQSPIGPAAMYSRSYVGLGAKVESVDRVRDNLLDEKYWDENATLGEWETRAGYLEEIESVMGDADDTFSTLMDDFYSALEGVSTDPGSASARTAVKEAGVAICDYLNDSAARLTQLRQDANTEVKTTVDQINSYAQQIADLNKRISLAAASGAATNELEDARGALIDELSGLVDLDVDEVVVGTKADGTENKALTISIDGACLVSGDKVQQLECYEIADGSDQDGMYGIRWAGTGANLDPDGGSLQAYLDIRDGDGTGSYSESKGIPYFMDQLDTFARTFAAAFNEGIFEDGTTYYAGHAGGYTEDGETGVRFFSCSYTDSSGNSFEALLSGLDSAAAANTQYTSLYTNLTAANISLSADVLADADNIAAAASVNSDGSIDSEDNENMDALIELCESAKMFAGGTPEDFMNSLVSTLGTTSSYAQSKSDRQTTIIEYLENSRSSVAGVSSNEETANMTKYQKAYEASAQMISVWQEIYATTINMVSSD